MLDHVGDRMVQTFNRRDIETLVDWMVTSGGARGKGLSHRSMVYTLGPLRQVFAYGVATDVLNRNPAEDVSVRRQRDGDKATVSTWTPEELLTFRDVAARSRWSSRG